MRPSRSTPNPRRGRGARSAPTAPLLALLLAPLAACGAEEVPHPWLDLTGAPSHTVVEISGASRGQIVLAVPPGTPYEEVLSLAERIAEQVPPGATVNARIFDDEATARNWRTAPADWTLQHLLALVTGAPETGIVEIRWVGPPEKGPPVEPIPPESDSIPDPSP